MTNRDRIIEALRGTAPNAVYREVMRERALGAKKIGYHKK